MMMERRKRSASEQQHECVIGVENKQEVMEASYSMLRGFLNALDAQDKICSNFFVCEAAEEASKLGLIGKMLAKVASSNAESWLTNTNSTLHHGTQLAGEYGTLSGNQTCNFKFPCSKYHTTYKKPVLINMPK